MSAAAPVSCALSKDILMIFIPEPPRPNVISDLEGQFPGLEVRWVNSWDSNENRRRGAEEIDRRQWDGVTLLQTSWIPPPEELLSTVRYVQLSSAGADKWAQHATYKNPDVIFCTANGVHPPQIAEWVIGAWLSHQHEFMKYATNMKEGKWSRPANSYLQDSVGARMGILGYGAIGRQVARVAKVMGMEVYAYTRTEKPTPESRKDDSYCVPGIEGDPDGVIPAKWFHGGSKESINEFLAQDLDIVVMSLPLTAATRGIISSEQFEIMSKKKTFLCNIARGAHVDQPALIRALESGQIRGAALDVADPEPLPQDDPLWKAPNLLLTPHVSWHTTDYYGRNLEILRENLTRLSEGQKLMNMINRELNY